ncbi:hypothetical protein BDA96_04G024900 [Sorghum bicolor]|uniref:Uncharacterized protein n=2 Tax=Sorghum bicolor TaxID=4558 RepID=A0A921UGQ3_SORBI|nr:hypothetical protein BDA96_04G024900 [Sorghum bicolor]OQU84256.1 hypothetical protein SORBI_3004G022366 [Sorghum bicolor]
MTTRLPRLKLQASIRRRHRTIMEGRRHRTSGYSPPGPSSRSHLGPSQPSQSP